MPVTTFTTDQKIQIVCEHIKTGITVKEICRTHNVKQSTFYYWKNTYFPNDIEEKFEEREGMDVLDTRVVLRGINKEYFLADCKRRGWNYGRMAKNIVDVYYSIQSNRPDMEGKEMTEIKKMLTDIVKFK